MYIFLKKNKALLLFFISFLMFIFLLSKPTFADVDSFYHAKMALQMEQSGVVTDMHWMRFSILNTYFADQYFLYHAALIPFVKFFGGLLGTKIAAIFFASFAVTAFYWLQKKLHYSQAFLSTLLLLLPSAFLFRLNLAKAQPLAFSLLYIFIYFLFQKNAKLIFLLSFLFVWLHGSWPLSMVVVFLFFFSQVIEIFFSGQKDLKAYRSVFVSSIPIFLTCFFGSLFGLIVNPYFPKNLIFYWQQIIQIAVINYKNVIDVGGEWLAYGFLDFVTNANISLFIFLFCFFIFVRNVKKIDRQGWFFLLSSLVFLIMAVKSRRNIEYFIPFSILSGSWTINRFFEHITVKDFFLKIQKYFLNQKFLWPFGIFLLSVFPLVIVSGYLQIKKSHDNGYAFDYLSGSSLWLKENSSAGQLVFTSSWDEFPMLFYNNDQNVYLVGLDPTFFYNYNRPLYLEWRDVTSGKSCDNMYSIIKEKFMADYVLLTLPKFQDFAHALDEDQRFFLQYSDNEARVYKVL